MARKTKEEQELDKKVPVKKASSKKATTKATSKVSKAKKSDAKKADVKKPVSKTTTTKKAVSKKTASKVDTAKEPVAKETITKKADKKVSTTKKATSKKTASKTVDKKIETKKETNSKKVVKEKTTSKKSSPKAKTTSKTKKTTKKAPSKASAKIIPIDPLEYYDLPYRYNQTVVKVLAQNPNTLFVYWDISDEDRNNFENKYGKDFFYKTRPVLVIHNLTDNYTFEIDINDFANNWYVNVNDTKCKYIVELGRRPNYFEPSAIPVNYLNVAFSNTIEIPNDHILFFKENDRIYFKNPSSQNPTSTLL